VMSNVSLILPKYCIPSIITSVSDIKLRMWKHFVDISYANGRICFGYVCPLANNSRTQRPTVPKYAKKVPDRRVLSTIRQCNLGYSTYASSVSRDQQTPPRHASSNLVYDRNPRRYAENNRT